MERERDAQKHMDYLESLLPFHPCYHHRIKEEGGQENWRTRRRRRRTECTSPQIMSSPQIMTTLLSRRGNEEIGVKER